MDYKSLSYAAAAVGLLIWYFRNDAVGTRKIDSKIQRANSHLPLIGSTFGFLKNINRMSEYLCEELLDPSFSGAKVFSIAFTESAIMINDPESLEYVLNTNFENYVKGSFFSCRLSEFLGQGIFNVDGHHWYIQRKIGSKIFTTRAFKTNIETVFTEKIKVFLNLIESTNGKAVDVHDMFHKFFMDTFGKIAYGYEIDSMSKTTVPFAQAFDRIQKVTSDRFSNPLFKYTDPFVYPGFNHDIQVIREFGTKIIQERKRGGTESKSDLLSLFMDYTNEDGSKLDDDQLIDSVLNFLLAGRDTTAQALSWTFYCLFKNQAALKTLNKEIETYLQEEEIPDYDTIKKMKYANAVFKETLRLYPSVPRVAKIAVNDDVLPNGTNIPRGAVIGYVPYAFGRNKDVWEDPLTYKPERWLSGKQATQYEYPVFNCGPRICLGKSLAEIQGVFVLVCILKKYHFTVENMDMIVPGVSLTFPMKHGMQVRFYNK